MQCLKPILLRPGALSERQVPCGKCVACLANRRAEWCARLKIEQAYSDWSLFVTLTYSNDYLPFCPDGKPGFDKTHLQRFLKSVRKSLDKPMVRYYIISEYGEYTLRPHYHALLFLRSLPGDVDERYRFQQRFYDLVRRYWHYGHVQFGDVQAASIAYVTKYMLKDGAFPGGIKDDFVMMSLKPAIGSQILQEDSFMQSFHEQDVSRLNFYGDSSRMPRYHRDRILQEMPDEVENRLRERFLEFQRRYSQEKALKIADWQENGLVPFEKLKSLAEYKTRQKNYHLKSHNKL